MAHRIDGRKFGRKTAPRQAMYANLIVAVLRYEQIKTTEAKAKELGYEILPGEAWLEQDVTILIPAALEGVIHLGNAERIRAFAAAYGE